MKASSRRERTILRIRRRQNTIGLTDREWEVLEETKLYRTMKRLFPRAYDWQIRRAMRYVEGREDLFFKLRTVNKPRYFKTPYGRGSRPDSMIVDEVVPQNEDWESYGGQMRISLPH